MYHIKHTIILIKAISQGNITDSEHSKMYFVDTVLYFKSFGIKYILFEKD